MTFSTFPYVIAEAGTGHLGSVIRAKELAHRAKAAGADAVKYQMFVPDEPLFCPYEGDEKRHQRWWDTALTLEEWKEVRRKCDALGIDFLASVFQDTGIDWLLELDPPAYKVASRAARTYPYDRVPGPFVISNGMWYWAHRDLPKEVLENSYILQCKSEYPTPLESCLYQQGSAFNYGNKHWFGLSDHSGTPWPAIDALAHEAPIIEVHFGDKEGPDAAVNLSFDELKLICDFRNALKEMRGD